MSSSHHNDQHVRTKAQNKSASSGQLKVKRHDEAKKNHHEKTQDYLTLNGFEPTQQIDGFLSRRCGHRLIEIPSNKLSLEMSGKLNLSNVLVSAFECSKQLEVVQHRLSYFASKNDVFAKAQKGTEERPNSSLLAYLSHSIMKLSKETFAPAHKLCAATIGLYMTEDFIRNPTTFLSDEKRSNHSGLSNRIQLPSKFSNERTLLKLKYCVESSTDIFAKFDPKTPGSVSVTMSKDSSSTRRSTNDRKTSRNENTPYFQMRETLLIMRRAIQDLHTTAVGSIDLLNLLLYINYEEKLQFAQYLKFLNSIEKSDLLEDISTLRRTVDLFPLKLEKLSWTSSTLYYLVSGHNLSSVTSVAPIQLRGETSKTANASSKKEKELLKQEQVNPSDKNASKSLDSKFELQVSTHNQDDILNGNVGSSSSSLQENDEGKDSNTSLDEEGNSSQQSLNDEEALDEEQPRTSSTKGILKWPAHDENNNSSPYRM